MHSTPLHVLTCNLQCIKGVYFETAVSGPAVPSKMDILHASHPDEQLAYMGLELWLYVGREDPEAKKILKL